MSLLLAHELGLLVSMLCAFASVLLGGETPWLWPLLLSAPAATLVRLRQWRLPQAVGTAVGACGLLAGIYGSATAGAHQSVPAALTALAALCAGRLLNRQLPQHDLQLQLLATLMVFAGTVVHQQWSFGVCLLLYAVSATFALLTGLLVSACSQEAAMAEAGVPPAVALAALLGRRNLVTMRFFGASLVVALCMLGLAAGTFLLFPRLGLGGGTQQGGTRLPAAVELGSAPRAGRGGPILARLERVSFAHYSAGLYLRSEAYDVYDRAGRFFVQPQPQALRPHLLRLAASGAQQTYTVQVATLGEQTLPTLGPTKSVRVLQGGFANPSLAGQLLEITPTGTLQALTPLTGPMRYQVVGTIAHPRDDPPEAVPDTVLTGSGAVPDTASLRSARLEGAQRKAFLARFMGLPAGLDPRIATLADRLIAGKATSAQRVAAISSYLRSSMHYTLDGPPPGTDPLAAFLFEHRRGHCEYFAAALAVLLRAAQVPARVVGGLAFGSWDSRAEQVIFAGHDAHAWVEWFDPAHGWWVVDATPPQDPVVLGPWATALQSLRRLWDDKVVLFGLQDQLALAAAVQTSLPPRIGSHLLTQDHLRHLMAAAMGLGLATALALAWYRRAAASQRTQSLLVQTLETIRGAPLPSAWTLREAVQQLAPRAPTPAAQAVLHAALQLHELQRFAAVVPAAPDVARVHAGLLRLRRSRAAGRGRAP